MNTYLICLRQIKHQRLKTGDLRRPPYLLFDSFMVVVLAYIINSPTEPKSRTLSLRKGPLFGRRNRPLRRNRKGIRFLMSLANIKSNMKFVGDVQPALLCGKMDVKR